MGVWEQVKLSLSRGAQVWWAASLLGKEPYERVHQG